MLFKKFPKKSLGQNFLIDSNIVKKIVNVSSDIKNKTILEIGPGSGNLTTEILSRKPKKVIAIEKDKNLSILLKNRFIFNKNFENYDFMKVLFFTVFVSFISQIGDLFISFLKRKANVKDTSDILPGHGGLLDRVDGIIFALPFGIFLSRFLF